MVIAPCSIKTLSALANSHADTLIARAGDVTLKEGRPLVVVVRETPLHVGHLRQMLALAEMGAVILPPSRPSTTVPRRSGTSSTTRWAACSTGSASRTGS